jgi:hypothetical protein
VATSDTSGLNMAPKVTLGHASVAVTQYLPTDRAKIEDLILKGDWTRAKKVIAPKIASKVALPAKPLLPRPCPAPCLPGFEDFAA